MSEYKDPAVMQKEPPKDPDGPDQQSWVGMLFSERVFNFAVATAALLVIVLPVGLAAIYLGYIRGESPCTLCGYERFGMVAIAVVALFILRYGPHRKYVFMLFALAFFFLYTTVIHWQRHAVRDAGQGLAEDVFGAHTYTWGVFVYWIVILFAGIGLLWIGRNDTLRAEFGARKPMSKKMSKYSMVSGVVVFAMVIANSVQFFIINGPPPFHGTGQPPRMSLDIGRLSQNWSMSLWERIGDAPVIHEYSPPMVHIPGVHEVDDLEIGNAADAPIAVSGSLDVVDSTELGFDAVGPFGGQAGGIAYDESSETYGIVSTGGGVYYVDEAFQTPTSSAVFDTVNGNNISHTADAMFLGSNQLVGMAWNKTLYGTERVGSGTVDDFEEWKEFRETSGDLEPVFGSKNREMLKTVRSQSSFALSVAMDTDSGLYSVVNVPSPQVEDIVISQFGPDHLLAREGVLTAAGDEELDLSSYYPVGATIVDGQMYMLSKTYQSLLVVDMDTLSVTDAWELPEVGDYHGLAYADEALAILSDVDGTDTVFEVTMPEAS